MQQLSVDNRTDSDFGAGWTLASLEQLIPDTSGATYINGSGTSGWFSVDGGAFAPPSGSLANSGLTENADGSFTLEHANGYISDFDASGRLESQTNPQGHATIYGWDASGLLTTVTDIYNRITTFTYQNDLLLEVTDWAGQTIDIVHDASDMLTSISSSYYYGAGPQLPSVTDYTYDADGRVTSVSDSVYHVSNLTYDAGGRLSQAVLPGGATWSFDSVITQAFVDPASGSGTVGNPATIFDPADAQATWTNPDSNDMELIVNAAGHVIERTGFDGSTTTFTRDDDGRVLTTTLDDPDGAGPLTAPVTTHTYDSNGQKTSTAYPGGASESWTYHATLPLPISHLNVLGGTTSYTWNTDRTLASVTDVSGAVTSFTYDSYGNVLTQTLPDPDDAGPKTSTVITNVYDAFGRMTSSSAAGVSTSVTYDTADRVTSTTNALGNTTSYVWTDLGRVESITYPDPDGAGPLTAPVHTFTWDWMGRKASETRPDGLTVDYAYNTAGLLESQTIVDPDGSGPLTDLVTSFTYDALNRILSTTDAMNNVSSATYDAAGRMLTITSPDPDGAGPLTAAVTAFAYDAIGRLIEQTDALGHKTTQEYDAAGNHFKTTNDLGLSWTNSFDIGGRVTASIDPLGNTTSYTYDAVGNLLTTTLPDPDDAGPLSAPVATITYDNLGRATSAVSFDGETRSVDYDSLGRTVSQTNADGGVTTYGYNAAGQVTSGNGVDPDGAGPEAAPLVSVTYDNLGRPIQQTAPDGSTTDTEYNNLGQVASVTDGEGRTTTYTYDEFGRAISVADSLGNTVSQTFDNLHRRTHSSDGLGNSSTYLYDNLSRLISQTDSNTGTTTTEFDALGRVTSLTDPLGNETSWTYDAVGQMLSDTNELGDSRSYVYDAAGRLTSRIDRNGRVISFGYDNMSRQTSQQWMDAGVAVNTISTTYDADLNVASISDDDSAYAFTWDADGRLLTVDNTGTVGLPDVVLTNTYDDLGRQTGLSATIDGVADFINSYSYDANSRVASIIQTDGAVGAGDVVSDKRVDLAYDDSGRFTSIARYEDLTATDEIATSTYAYDNAGRLTSLNHMFGGTALAGYGWTWNAAHQITNYTSVLDGSVAFGYDSTGQLTSEARTDLAGNTVTDVFTYDYNGNRITAGETSAPSTYTTGTNNRTLSDGTYNYEYDAEGNRTKRTDIATGDEIEYVWNHANLLTDVVYKDDQGTVTKTVSYTYDALGRRIGKSVNDTANGTIDRSQSFVYDGVGLLAASGGSIHIHGPNGQLNQHGWVDDLVLVFEDTDGDGPGTQQLASRFLHGPAIDQIFAQESASGDVLWALTDHQGTVRDWAESADFDSNGTVETQVINHLHFDAFGNLRAVTDDAGNATTLDSRLTVLPAYTGQLYDADAGLHYYRARWYDSVIGRFVSEDPMGFAAGDTNVSRYVGNAAQGRTDPSGLDMYVTGQSDHTEIAVDYWVDGQVVAVIHIDFGADGWMNDPDAGGTGISDNVIVGAPGEFVFGITPVPTPGQRPPGRPIQGNEAQDMALIEWLGNTVFGRPSAIEEFYNNTQQVPPVFPPSRVDAPDDGDWNIYTVGGHNCHNFSSVCIYQHSGNRPGRPFGFSLGLTGGAFLQQVNDWHHPDGRPLTEEEWYEINQHWINTLASSFGAF